MIEHMFARSPYHDYFLPSDTAQSRGLIAQLGLASRAENRAAALRLKVIGELFELRRGERGERADWAVDTWAAVGAEVAAALQISLAKAGSYLTYALAMLTRPAVAAVFLAGDIDMGVFQTIYYRTELITDAEVMATVDRELAERVAHWPSMTRGRLATKIDQLVARHDRDAVRQAKEKTMDRRVSLWDQGNGTTELAGLVMSTDAAALDARLDALAATVCPDDPRTLEQRRADALGALAVGMDRLACRCDSTQCPAGQRPASPGVVIHLVAEQSSVAGRSETPACLLGPNTLVSAELVAELAKDARVRPLMNPAQACPESGYRPSTALAEFVRARDLTCRAPGCDRPATHCDLDHTIPWPAGPTHASNIKALCRVHHLLKTFWGWRDTQMPDGTVIWTLPGGHRHVTTPGSALLFPRLCLPTGEIARRSTPVDDSHGERTAMMPTRRRTREQNRAARITAERAHNRALRPITHAYNLFGPAPPPPDNDADPPPF